MGFVDALKKPFTVLQVLASTGSFIARLVGVATMILAGYVWTDPNASLATVWQLSWQQLLLILVLSGVVIVSNSLRTWISESSTDAEDQAIILKGLEGIIDRFDELRHGGETDRTSVVSALLHAVEQFIRMTLIESGSEPRSTGSLSANLMIYDKGTESLVLEQFGTRLQGREKLTLQVSKELTRPGAPQAILKGETVYIEDTHADRYAAFFDTSKSYRSIVSVPIELESDQYAGVINIDSPTPNHFRSSEFVKTEILPVINPLLRLIRLNRDIFFAQSSTQTD